ncbi:MAG: UDP-glucose--hexose-1-phosphate uridylyltransferase [Ruminococcus sp.]|jgi:UDPglucose--hexose-1-phosphate uridylyltransferase
MVNTAIKKLIAYGLERRMIKAQDVDFIRNQILEVLELDEYEEPEENYDHVKLEPVLKELLDDAAKRGVLKQDTVTCRDLLDTKIMGKLVPWPSEVNRIFWELYGQSPKKATDYFYHLSQDSNYIRRDRIARDEKWEAQTEYGNMEITINLSKPEKDPKDIAAARNAASSSYPKCLLCGENEGYAGRLNHPARQNHRIISLNLQEEEWGLQYSPYVYYNEHCIVLNRKHVPMKISGNTFRKLLEFVGKFPHYFLGSNADLPIVGGSILSHDHFQGGCHEFAMAKAEVERTYSVRGFQDVNVGIVKWPMSVIRLEAEDPSRLAELAEHILENWRNYTDETVAIYACTEGEPHNTITPIARMRKGRYELDLVLRNNLTTEKYPLGIYHPHEKLHHIKKENIGLIEVMGLAVLPARLKKELNGLAEAILKEENIEEKEELKKHADWVKEFLPSYDIITEKNIMPILQKEVGKVFEQVLEDAGVFKRTKEGKEAFERFIAGL